MESLISISGLVAQLLLLVAGIAVMLRLRRLARLLVLLAVTAFLGPHLGPLLSDVPWWILLPMGVAVFFALLREVLTLSMGREVANHVVGTLVADIIRWLFSLPFGILGRIFRR